MEHRVGKRVTGNFYVEVVHGDKSHGCCTVANIGDGGVCLSGLENGVNEGDFLTLKFFCGANPKPSFFERRAMVVYLSDNDLGLMWVDTQSNFLAIINTMNKIAA